MKKKPKQPTTTQLADCAGMREEAFKKIEHLTVDEMVALATLMGVQIKIEFRPRKDKLTK